MNFEPNEDQALLKAAVERFVDDSYGGDLTARRAARLAPTGFAAAHWARLADTGLLGLAVSAANGGLGGGRIELMATLEALGRGLVAEPVLEAAVMPGLLLDDGAGAAALPGLIDGTTLFALAHLEREARHNLAYVGTTARADGEGVVLDGLKIAVTPGLADQLIVSAAGPDGVGLYLVAADAPGVDRRTYRLADGAVAAEITLRGVRAGARIGDLATLLAVVPLVRLAATAEILGLMTLLFDTTLAYVKTRQQFGQPLGRFQVIQHRMTDAYVLVEQARSQLLRAVLAPEADFARAAAGAKSFVAEAALSVGHTAVQMHGGMGLTDELVIGHALKRVRVLALCLGDSAAALSDYAAAA
ncbi:MAG: hypothetical protein RL490_745 [Pseudomonadota bacterium]|jgi:alkylation response protein AidB-like acyl-CoA dehydrogenase